MTELSKEQPASERNSTGLDLRKADAAYKPFPAFAEWSKSNVAMQHWDRYAEELRRLRSESAALLTKALEIVKRAAAVDTGAIEGLYDTDRGFTFTIASEAAHWEAALAQKGPRVRALFDAQLAAYDFVIDLATQAVPIAEAWIRQLHEELCRPQDTYRIWTEVGWQEQALPKGQYKYSPNHVLKADGTIHSYAPVDMTPTEMYRLCEELRSESFLAAHSALQASYAHYALAVIHPFADGNGRVARALASVFTCRALSVPILILTDTQKDYLESLAAADAGDFQPFVDFILSRTLDAIRLASDSIHAAESPSVEESVAALKRLYITKVGMTQAELDEAGYKLFEVFREQLMRRAQAIAVEGVFTAGFVLPGAPRPPRRPSHLAPKEARGRGGIILRSADEQVLRFFQLEVPKVTASHEDLVIRALDTTDSFEARVAEVVPPSAALQLRLSIWIGKLLADALAELTKASSSKVKNQDS
jgi:Fic family protein